MPRTARTGASDDRSRLLAALESVWLTRAVAAFAVCWFALYYSRPELPGWVAWAPAEVIAAQCWVVARATAAHPIVPDKARPFWRMTARTGQWMTVVVAAQAYDALRPPGPPVQHMGVVSLVPYVGTALMVATSLWLLPYGRKERPDWFTFGLDLAIVATTLGLFTLYFSHRFGGGLADATAASTLAMVPVGLVVAPVMLKIGLGGIGPVDRRALRLVVLATVISMTGFGIGPLLADRPWLAASYLAYPLGFAGLIEAAHAQRLRSAPAPVRSVGRLRFTPYLAVVLAYGLLLAEIPSGRSAEAIGAGVALLTAMVIIRQFAALRENSRLLAQLDRNVLDLQASEDRAVYRASHDELTDLANRALFNRRMAAALAADPHRVFAVLIDLDDFKAINDRLGHDVGDALLVGVAGRLTACVRATDLVGRLGGDEFVVLLEDTDADQGRRTVERILASLTAPLSVAGYDLLVSASIGLAAGRPGLSDAALLRQADVAMYVAKERGKDGWAAYDPEMDVRASKTAELGAALRQGLDRDEFRLVYQPIVTISDGAMYGVEALVRWKPAGRGAVSAAEFIPAAERTGLIVPLGRWVLAEACRQAVRWHDRFGERAPRRVNVNVSARQLREPGFADEVATVLDETGLDPAVLVVEVTETTVFDGGAAVATLEALTQLGCGVALDDFGTGHSSLGLLRTCPVDVLKVDKSFVDGVLGTSEEAAIATFLVQVADGLRLMTVAEGVESQAQAQRLQALGYRYAQGFYFAPPLPPAELESRMAAAVAVA
jgi:diguanylate cyclase (GGDEF)-like protein